MREQAYRLNRKLSLPKVRLDIQVGMGISFIAINAMFAARFGSLLFAELEGWPDTHITVYLAAIGGVLSLTFLGFTSRFRRLIFNFLNWKPAILVIIGGFVLTTRPIDWATGSIDEVLRLDIWAWHFAIFLWALFLWFAIQIRASLRLINLSDASETPEQTRRLSFYRRLVLVLVSLLLIGYWLFFHVIRPAPYHVNYDPEVAYIMNSMTPFASHRLYLSRMDHPGTPLQLLGSASYLATYPLALSHPQAMTSYRFLEPAPMLVVARGFLLGINLIALAIIGQRVFPLKNSTYLFAGLSVALLYFALDPLAISFLTTWSPNAFNFAFGTLLLLALFLLLRSNPELKRRQLLALGFLAGILATFQLYLIVWSVGITITVLVYCWLRRPSEFSSAGRAAAFVIAGSFMGFVASTLVIYPHYISFFDWVKGLIWHQGEYGKGAPGIMDLEQLAVNFKQFVRLAAISMIAFVLIAIPLLVMLVRKRKLIRQDAGLWAMVIGLTIQIVLLCLIVIKQPTQRYMLSVTATLPIMLAVMFALMDRHYTIRPSLLFGILWAVLVMIVFNFGTNLVLHHQIVDGVETSIAEAERFSDELKSDLAQMGKQPTILWTFRTHSRCYLLRYADSFAIGLFTDTVEEICPNDLDLTVWSSAVLVQGERIPLDEFSAWDAIVTTPARLEQLDLDQEEINVDTSYKNLAVVTKKQPTRDPG